MNITIIKLIALISMILDHIGAAFGITGWNIIPSDISKLFRIIGRVSFPLFAFSIANGWNYTKNRENYFKKMIIFSIISQIPYTLAFYPVNTMKLSENTNSFHCNVNTTSILIYLLLTSLSIGYYYLYISNNLKILISIALSLLFSIFTLKLNYIWFNADALNIFYTIIIGIMYLYCYEYIKKFHKLINSAILCIIVLLITVYIGLRTDYGSFLLGPILILLLYICKDIRWLQSVLIICWGCVLYGIIYKNWENAIAVIPATIFILFYNNKKGFSKKLFFYFFYPIHLLLIGLINIIIKFA